MGRRRSRGRDRCLATIVLTVSALIADRLKTISCSPAGWKFHSSPSSSSRRTRLFQSLCRAVYADPEKTVGSISVGMLDFILPRNPGGLIGKGRHSVHVREGTWSLSPFPALIRDPHFFLSTPPPTLARLSVKRGSHRQFYRRCFPSWRAFFVSLSRFARFFPRFLLFPLSNRGTAALGHLPGWLKICGHLALASYLLEFLGDLEFPLDYNIPPL